MGSEVTEEDHAWTMRRHNVAEPMKEFCVSCHGNDISQTVKGAIPKRSTSSRSGRAISPITMPTETSESLKGEILGLENVDMADQGLRPGAFGRPGAL